MCVAGWLYILFPAGLVAVTWGTPGSSRSPRLARVSLFAHPFATLRDRCAALLIACPWTPSCEGG